MLRYIILLWWGGRSVPSVTSKVTSASLIFVDEVFHPLAFTRSDSCSNTYGWISKYGIEWRTSKTCCVDTVRTFSVRSQRSFSYRQNLPISVCAHFQVREDDIHSEGCFKTRFHWPRSSRRRQKKTQWAFKTFFIAKIIFTFNILLNNCCSDLFLTL